jgi:27-O-demethylrifamycin SV methyltransferase
MEPLGLYAELARDNDLSADVELDLTRETRPTFARWRDNAERHREDVVAQLGEDDWARFVESTVVLEGFWDDGTLGYGLIAAARA